MKKRLFIAIPLSQKYLETFISYRENFNSKGIRWTSDENLHLTVCFFGDIEENFILEITGDLKEFTSQIKPFVLKFNKILLAPPGRPPRMIWGMFFGDENYQNLTDSVYRAAQKYLNEKQEPKATPHITLARFKDFFDPSGLRLTQVKLPELSVSNCQLISSELTSAGPIYTIIKIFKFFKK